MLSNAGHIIGTWVSWPYLATESLPLCRVAGAESRSQSTVQRWTNGHKHFLGDVRLMKQKMEEVPMSVEKVPSEPSLPWLLPGPAHPGARQHGRRDRREDVAIPGLSSFEVAS